MAEPPAKDKGKKFASARSNRLSSARLAAVQAIYQLEMTEQSGMTESGASAVIEEFLYHRGGAELGEGERSIEADRALFAEIVRGVARECRELDRMISTTLTEDWPLNRIEKVMAAILRAGAFELLHRADVPARVVVSEYVDVAHAFLEGKEVGMVNGVLDRLARVLRETEMEDAAGKRQPRGKEPSWSGAKKTAVRPPEK